MITAGVGFCVGDKQMGEVVFHHLPHDLRHHCPQVSQNRTSLYKYAAMVLFLLKLCSIIFGQNTILNTVTFLRLLSYTFVPSTGYSTVSHFKQYAFYEVIGCDLCVNNYFVRVAERYLKGLYLNFN